MPKAKTKEKEMARDLREKGKSIKDISKLLKVSKSSASYWCRDIKLSQEQVDRLSLKQKNGAIQLGEKKRQERIDFTNKLMRKGIKSVGILSRRDLFMIGLALYWGEGYKKGNQEMGLTNSDPEIIKVFIRWLKEIYEVQKKNLILRVSINSLHAGREKEVIKYWSKVTGVPENQFTKTSFIKTTTKKLYGNRNAHFGTLRVKVRRGTNLRREVLGAIGALKM